MRKLLLALFALALVVAFTAPSYAAELKYSGFFRVRGSSENVNKDGDDDADDKRNYLDALIRPRFTAKSGAITAVWEPEFRSANGGFGSSVNFGDHITGVDFDGREVTTGNVAHEDGGASRQTVGVNRWVIDFAIPGSALRMRMGRTDYFSPDKEIYDSGGRHREPGIAIYGKLSKNISLSAFMTKANEDNSADNDDQTDYYVGVGIKVTPNLTVSPWAANSRDTAEGGYDYSFLGLHAKTKVGILNVNGSVVIQEGDLSSGDELSGWAVLVRTSTSLGKLKLSGNLTMLSGNDGSKAGEDGRFRTPQEGGSGWFDGGHIMSSRRWTSLSNGIRSVHLGALNGATVIEGLADFKVSKTLTLGGGVSLYNSAEPSNAPDTMDAKEFGTELNAGFKWKIHSTLELRGVGAVILRGDYGRGVDEPEIDDGWAVGWTLRHIF